MLRTFDSLLLLVLYVDDSLIVGCSTSTIATVKRILHDRFLMTDMGPLQSFLGLEINQDTRQTVSSQVCTRFPRKIPHDRLQVFPNSFPIRSQT
jgi:hypothetical protein